MAKSSIIGNVVVIAEVDTSGIRKGIDQAKSSLSDFGRAANGTVTSGTKGLSSQLGLVGAGMSALGVAGLGAGVALGAFSAAMSQTRSALDFVDTLGDTATKLHVNVQAMQEWQFAAQEANLNAEDFDTSIQGLQSSVGKLISGIGAGRVKAAFDQLGITKEQAASFKNVDEMLPLIADKLVQVGNEAQRVAIADKLGLRPLLPLLEQGSAKIAEMTKKAHDLGLVIDNETAASMGEMQRQAELASQSIDVNLKKAFLTLAPVLITSTHLVSDWVAEARRSIEAISDFVSIRDGVDHRLSQTSQQIQTEMGNVHRGREAAASNRANGRPEAAARNDAYANAAEARLKALIKTQNDEAAAAAKAAELKAKQDEARAKAQAKADADALKKRLGSNGGLGGGVSAAAVPGLQWNSQTSTLAQINPATTGQDWSEEISSTIKAKDWGPVFADMNQAISDNTLGGLVNGINEAQAATQAAFASSIRGGLEAGMRGGIPGIMEYLGYSLKTKLLDSLSTGIANMLSGSGFGSSGGSASGGKVGLFATAAKFGAKLFGIPGFASGTSYAPGGLAMVGERGPELVNLPRGSRVHTAGSTAAMGATVVQHFHVNAAGSILAADLRNEMQVIGIRSAMAGAQGGAMKAKQDMQRSGWDRFA